MTNPKWRVPLHFSVVTTEVLIQVVLSAADSDTSPRGGRWRPDFSSSSEAFISPEHCMELFYRC